MRIKIYYNLPGDWKECWLETQYVGTSDETFRCFIYPITWSQLYRTDGHVQYSYCNVDVKTFVKDSGEWFTKSNLKNERTLTQMQKISNVFKRIFSWKCKA